jgi:hypothetical protein
VTRAPAVTAPPGRANPAGRLLAVNFAACLLLLAQFLLGMVVNLCLTLPGRHPGAAARDYFTGAASGLAWAILHGPGWAAAHAAFGLALVLAASMTTSPPARGKGMFTGLVSSAVTAGPDSALASCGHTGHLPGPLLRRAGQACQPLCGGHGTW